MKFHPHVLSVFFLWLSDKGEPGTLSVLLLSVWTEPEGEHGGWEGEKMESTVLLDWFFFTIFKQREDVQWSIGSLIHGQTG